MRSHMTAVCVVALILFVSQPSLCDSIVVSYSSDISLEDHSYRTIVSIGDDIDWEVERYGPPTGFAPEIPLLYSIPKGFELTSAVLDVYFTGIMNMAIAGSSIPQPGSENNFVPGNMHPVIANDGPWVSVTVGGEPFWLTFYPTGECGSIDLWANGYGNLLQQDTPINLYPYLTLWSYMEQGDGQWWGRNAITSYRIDQSWSGSFGATLTLTVERVPEPATLLLLTTGLLVLPHRQKKYQRRESGAAIGYPSA